jgi:hypothetical protein
MKLQYRILHVQEVSVEKSIEFEGQPGIVTVKRQIVEMAAEGHDGGTIMISAPAATEHFAENAICEVSFRVLEAGGDA